MNSVLRYKASNFVFEADAVRHRWFSGFVCLTTGSRLTDFPLAALPGNRPFNRSVRLLSLSHFCFKLNYKENV